ncbi:MAG: ATPase, type, partial [Acidimicrobiales bacterium]|nr:ATPase, type [Acidimicrobiales bacterium]
MAATDLLRSAVPWGGRRKRRAVRRGHFAHVEVRGLDGPEGEAVRSLVERALNAEPWAAHARVVPPLGLVVVALDGDVELQQVVSCVEGVERELGVEHDRFPPDRPEHPADPAPMVRDVVAAATDVVALGAAVAGRVARVRPLRAEVGAITSLVHGEPRVRAVATAVVGPTVTNAGLATVNAGAQALSQGPAGLVVDLGHRLSLLGEKRARRDA